MTEPTLPPEYSLIGMTEPRFAARLAREAAAMTSVVPTPMAIGFGDDAHDAFVRAVMALPVGYTVALLPEGESLPDGSELGPYDFSLVEGTDFNGVRCRRMDPSSSEPTGPEITVPWAEVAHVHVY